MAILTQDRLRPLLQAASGPCVSIYLPMHRPGRGGKQDAVRFANSLREAERLLSDRHSPREIRTLLDPVAALPNADFWRHQAEGLAVLRSADVLEEFRVPLRVPELVVVAKSFHVRPLIRCLNSRERYFLVSLSRAGVVVFEGSVASLAPVSVAGLPQSLAEHAAGASRGRNPNLRATSPGAAGRRGPAAGEELTSYFRAVDRALRRALRRDEAPVILAGADVHRSVYRWVSRLKGLVEKDVAGGHDAMTPDELRARAWPIAQQALRLQEDRALERYTRAARRRRTREVLEDIVYDARRGRVRRLFLAAGVRVWGTFDPITGRILRTGGQRGSQDDDVLDDVAEAVFLYDGDVLTLPRDRMPHGHAVAAELR